MNSGEEKAKYRHFFALKVTACELREWNGAGALVAVCWKAYGSLSQPPAKQKDFDFIEYPGFTWVSFVLRIHLRVSSPKAPICRFQYSRWSRRYGGLCDDAGFPRVPLDWDSDGPEPF